MLALATAWWPTRLNASDVVIVAVEDWRLEPDREAGFEATGVIIVRRAGQEIRHREIAFVSAPDTALPEARTLPALPTGLRLPAGMVLHREISLPLAAERDLTAVLKFEMDRLTPFASDEVFWSTSLIARAPGPTGLRLNLLIVLRRPVELLAEALNRLNLRPGFVECPDGRIDLSAWQKRPANRATLALYMSCGVLALACLLIPPIRQQIALQNADQLLAAQAPARQEALLLRQKLATAAAGAAVLQAARTNDVLQSLAALTQALPDGTSLNDFSLQGSDLTIDGQSTNAAGLIAILAAAPGFRNPGFTAPVTRAIDGKTDLFSLHATVVP